MKDVRKGYHTVSRLSCHLVWVTKYRYPALQKRYWGRHFWATGYGAWSTGNITDKMVNEYLSHHNKADDNTDFIIEK